jgi:hypothetical protein
MHREVINSLAANAASGSSSRVSPVVDLSFKKFVQNLATSGSDKSFLIQKKYKQLMDPIVEDLSEEGTQSGERVDFGGSDSDDNNNPSSDSGLHDDRTRILALAAPSLEHEHTVVVIPIESIHPEIDCSQEGLGSQVIDAMEVDGSADPKDGTQQERRPRLSSRIAAQPNAAARIEDRARQIAAARDLSGTNINSENSFSVLDNDSIYSRALEMGVDPSTFLLENFDCLKDLEIARHQLDRKLQEKSTELEE